eukprot:TRINITY_DN16868_c0_g1_i1.p1 TRINITY_DN16868_c0_g1~~TRINITY_DN16868_c0_g1_i1.p1  ORF type:complete len:295 (-),score=11.92 TRINITY_DN16868_c0_g1_i1:98-982(-)
MRTLQRARSITPPRRPVAISRSDALYNCHGLGNAMFRFQSALGIAKGAGARLTLARGDFEPLQSVFLLDLTLFERSNVSELAHLVTYTEAHAHGFTAFQIPPNGAAIQGYLQHLGYIQPLGLNLGNLKLFWRFHRSVVEQASNLLRRGEWIGVHVRRFPARHLDKSLDQSPSAVEYNAVIQHVVASTGLCVMVFSNDPEWARAQLSAPCMHIADNELVRDPYYPNPIDRTQGHATNPGRDLAALSMCHTLILSSGTFGWFAGILHSGAGGVYSFSKGHHRRLGMHPIHWTAYPL